MNIKDIYDYLYNIPPKYFKAKNVFITLHSDKNKVFTGAYIEGIDSYTNALNDVVLAFKVSKDPQSPLPQTETTQTEKNVLQEKPEYYKCMSEDVIAFCLKNKISFCEGNVIKYVCRFRQKGGVEDLKKARNYIDRLIEIEEKNT